jgi:hypothetical protein
MKMILYIVLLISNSNGNQRLYVDLFDSFSTLKSIASYQECDDFIKDQKNFSYLIKQDEEVTKVRCINSNEFDNIIDQLNLSNGLISQNNLKKSKSSKSELLTLKGVLEKSGDINRGKTIEAYNGTDLKITLESGGVKYLKVENTKIQKSVDRLLGKKVKLTCLNVITVPNPMEQAPVGFNGELEPRESCTINSIKPILSKRKNK